MRYELVKNTGNVRPLAHRQSNEGPDALTVLRRSAEALKERLHCPDDSVMFLERPFSLG